jgi:ketol-acid reductoisomerase
MISFQVNFQKNMMIDWDNDDVNLLTWRAATAETNFETVATTATISEQEYFDNGVLMIAMVKAEYRIGL